MAVTSEMLRNLRMARHTLALLDSANYSNEQRTALRQSLTGVVKFYEGIIAKESGTGISVTLPEGFSGEVVVRVKKD